MVRDRKIKVRGKNYREVDKRFFDRMRLKIGTLTITLTDKSLKRRTLYFAEVVPIIRF